MYVAAVWALAAVAGGLIYGLAGLAHARRPERGRLARVAMASDLIAAVVLLGACAAAALR